MITCAICKKTSDLKSYKGCCETTKKIIYHAPCNNNGCWIIKNKKLTAYINGIDVTLKPFVWKILKPEPKKIFDASFKIKNTCGERACCHPLHIVDKLTTKHTACRYCHLPFTQTAPKINSQGNPYPYCRKCYYQNKLKTHVRKCKYCKKELRNERLEYCNLICKFNNYIKKDMHECWIWTGKKWNGYPTLEHSKVALKSAKKWAFFIFKNNSAEELRNLSLKGCTHSKLCCNPDHHSFTLTIEQIKLAKKLYEKKWSFAEIGRKINIKPYTIKRYIFSPLSLTKSDEEIATYLICKQCQNKHDNRGSEFCSQECLVKHLDF